MRNSIHNAFTVVELLVVIAIVALLLSIVVPALSRAKAQASSAKCNALLAALFKAHYTYFTEFGELMPISVQDPVMRPWHTFDYLRDQLGLERLGPEYKTWLAPALQEYKPGYPRKFICPAAKFALTHSEDGLYPLDRSYGVNADPYNVSVYIRDKMMQHTSELLCLADALDWWFNYWECDKYSLYGETWTGFGTYGMAAFRHFDKANAVYWDGHCAPLTAEELKKKLGYWWRRPPEGR